VNATTIGLTYLFENDATLHPGAAKSWDISEDGLTYTFHLYDNIPWVRWNGSEVEKVQSCPDEAGATKDRLLTAGDFEYGIKRALAPETASDYAYVLGFAIKGANEYNGGKGAVEDVGVKAIDDTTLEVTFLEDVAYNINIIGLWTAHATPKWLIEGDDCTEARGDRWTEPGFFQGYGPFTLTATASTYVQRLARSVGGTTGLLLSAMLNPLLHDAALKAIPDRALADALHAILHNTVSPNQLRAGYKANVIPSEAEAILDGRMLPGFDVESFLAEVRPRLGEGIEITIEHTSPPLEVSSDTPLFRLIEQQIARADPGAIAVPYMMAGATDAKLFAKLGTQCYGYAPLKLQPDTPFDGLVHGHDERVSVDAFAFGVKLLYETVCDFCGQN